MSPEIRNKTQYLSLALFSQRVVRALLDYISEGRTSPSLDRVLREALNSLEPLAQGELPETGKAGVHAFSSYEQLGTLEEATSHEVRTSSEKAVQAIRRLLADPTSPDSLQRAQELLAFFKGIGDQARWNFEQPRSAHPSGLRELWQSG